VIAVATKPTHLVFPDQVKWFASTAAIALTDAAFRHNLPRAKEVILNHAGKQTIK
jgi:hypothetical protein